MKYKKGDIVVVNNSDYPAIIIDKIIDKNEESKSINSELKDITNCIKKKSNIKYVVSIREFDGDYCICEEININKIYLNNYKIIYEIMNYGDWWIEIHRDIFLNVLFRLI